MVNCVIIGRIVYSHMGIIVFLTLPLLNQGVVGTSPCLNDFRVLFKGGC